MSTLIQQIQEAIKPVKNVKTLKNDKGKVTVSFVSEANDKVVVKAEELLTKEALNRKVELVGYKRVETDSSIRKPLMMAIFGKTEVSVAEASEIRKTAELFNKIVKELTIIEAPAKEKTPFQKEVAAAQAKIQNVKAGKNKSVTPEQAQAELEAIYTKYGETYVPRKKKA